MAGVLETAVNGVKQALNVVINSPHGAIRVPEVFPGNGQTYGVMRVEQALSGHPAAGDWSFRAAMDMASSPEGVVSTETLDAARQMMQEIHGSVRAQSTAQRLIQQALQNGDSGVSLKTALQLAINQPTRLSRWSGGTHL